MGRLKMLKTRLNPAPSSRLMAQQPTWGRGRGGYAWRKLRLAVFRRDGFACRHCGRVCLPEDLDADHVINRARGGSDDLSNLQTLCRPCHKIKTAKESQGGWGD